MYEMTAAATSKALRLRRSAARKVRVALATVLVATALVAPTLAAGLVAPPAHATTTTGSTFVVNTTGDEGDANPGDGVCDIGAVLPGVCTLRAAIEEANAHQGADVINFAVFGSGVQPITPQSALPPITEQLTINGYTQRGASLNTKTVGDDAALKIELDGTNAPSDSGLQVSGASGSVIRGLVVHGFDVGIDIFGNSVGTRVEGNFIGTDPSGTLDKGNTSDGVGITAGASKTVVGGSTPDKRNVISGNGDTGIFIKDSGATKVKGNYVGTDRSGTKDLGNDDTGVFISNAPGTTVGGTTAASRNLISGNLFDGIDILSSQDTKLLGNRIGTTASGASALGNDLSGVFIQNTTGTQIGNGTVAGSNVLAFNGHDGVEIVGGLAATTGNEISRNSIFSNGGLGIDLVPSGGTESGATNIPTPNDLGDDDTGPNGLQNKPVLSSARTGSLKTTIKGNLDSKPGQTYTVEFYANPANTNEGKKFVGETTFTTSVDGLAAFTFSPATKVPVGQTITATTTNATTGSPHDTSEFSAPRTVASS